MKKRFAAVFAATAVLGVTTAFAANPFSDVTPNDWAYQSVAQLAAAGVINGYPDGTFKGQNNITRYEMAQMVAKAMANEARANAEQQALINRLADEFSSELNNLGVRVATLENKVGNVKVTGDVRLRANAWEDKGQASNSKDDKKSTFNYRGRIQFNANVNDNTSAVVRLTTGTTEFGNADGTKHSSDVEFDLMYVAHKFGQDVTGVIGRFPLFVGGGLIYDGQPFDGAALTYDNGNFSATAGYGSITMSGATLFSSYQNGAAANYQKPNNPAATEYKFGDADSNPTFTLLQAQGKLGEHVTLGGFYMIGNKIIDNDIYGGNLDLNFNKVWIGGEYTTFKDDKGGSSLVPEGEDKYAWIAGVGYGDYDIAKEGTWGIKVQYVDASKYSPIIDSNWSHPYNADYKGWVTTVDYALAKNVGLTGVWAFNGEDQVGNDIGDFYRAQLFYKF